MTAVMLRPATVEGRSWAHRGACAQPSAPLDFWSTLGDDALQRETAIHICLNHCPVLTECRAEAEAMSSAGVGYASMVAGGVSYDGDGVPRQFQRSAKWCRQCPEPAVVPKPRSPRVVRLSLPRQLEPCGTNAAFRRHQRAGEQSCAPCLGARRAYLRERKLLRRRTAVTR